MHSMQTSKNMAKPIYLYNTLTRRKEEFQPLHAPAVGMYVCGPTVYGDPHLGHVRPAVTFDLLFRLLRHEGYKVRYVRNITDVGHLENDADSGEDKIAKKARLEQLEPMEIAQHYTNRYHEFMDRLGVLRPSIEPHASGHIIEQIQMTQAILDAGYAYVSNGSVYFDVRKYVADGHNYGILSGRNLDEMQSGGRSDDYEGEKRLATTAMAATATVTKSRPVLSRSVPQLDDSVKVSTFSSSEGSQKADVKSQPRPRRKTSLDTPAVLPEHPIDKRNRKGWSLALAVGGHGTATNGNGSSASLMSDAITGVLLNTVPTANINLSAMTDGVISIPEGQSLAFREGKPYLMNRTRTVVSADHHQPVSVGFSVRKELGKGFSVETGLMYTFLSSDLRFEDSSEELSQKLHYLGIPLRANWNFVDTRLFTLYLSAGGAVEKCVYGKLGSDDLSQRPWQFSVLGAVGVQYNLSKRVGIYAEPGVSYYFDDASSLQTLRKEHPCSFTLQAGLRLTY